MIFFIKGLEERQMLIGVQINIAVRQGLIGRNVIGKYLYLHIEPILCSYLSYLFHNLFSGTGVDPDSNHFLFCRSSAFIGICAAACQKASQGHCS